MFDMIHDLGKIRDRCISLEDERQVIMAHLGHMSSEDNLKEAFRYEYSFTQDSVFCTLRTKQYCTSSWISKLCTKGRSSWLELKGIFLSLLMILTLSTWSSGT